MTFNIKAKFWVLNDFVFICYLSQALWCANYLRIFHLSFNSLVGGPCFINDVFKSLSMKEVKDKSNSLNVLVYKTGFHAIKGSEYPKVHLQWIQKWFFKLPSWKKFYAHACFKQILIWLVLPGTCWNLICYHRKQVDLYLWSQLHWSALTVILCAAYFGNLFWKQSCHLIVHKKKSLNTELCYYCAQVYGLSVCLKLFVGNPRADISSII